MLELIKHTIVLAESPGGGGTPLQEANGDVSLSGVTFSRVE